MIWEKLDNEEHIESFFLTKPLSYMPVFLIEGIIFLTEELLLLFLEACTETCAVLWPFNFLRFMPDWSDFKLIWEDWGGDKVYIEFFKDG